MSETLTNGAGETKVVEPVKASKPKKGGKKPPAPPKEKRTRKRPEKVRTLASWLREQGPDHVAAADILGRGTTFKDELRTALKANDEFDRAGKAQERAVEALRDADERLKAAGKALADADEVVRRLNALAETIKAARPAPKPAEPPATPLFDGTSPQ